MSEKSVLRLNAGCVIDVCVQEVEQYGVWVDFEGLVGFVDFVEVDWEHKKDPREVLESGMIVPAKVLLVPSEPHFSRGGHRTDFVCSLKQVDPTDDPWYPPGSFAVGQEFEGEVTRITDYGAFVRLPGGLEGLLETKKMRKQHQTYDIIRIKIVEVDESARQMRFEEIFE